MTSIYHGCVRKPSYSRKVATHHFAIKNNAVAKEVIQRRSFLKSHKAESLASSRLSVDHDGGIDNASMLREVRLEGFGSHRRCEASDKKLLSALVLKTRDGAFGIDLHDPIKYTAYRGWP